MLLHVWTEEERWRDACMFNVNVFLWQIVLLVIHDIDTNDRRAKSGDIQ